MAVYFLNTHQETIGMISFDDAIEVFQEQEIKDDSSLLNDVATVTIKNDKKLAEAAYFAIRAYSENKQTFDVYEVHSVKTDKTTTFTGVQLAARELEGYVVEDIRPENRSIEYVANQILAGTDWQIGYVESGLPNVTSSFYYLSVKDALKQLQSFGCEFKFKVEISGNRITDKFVEIYSQMGDRTGQRFTYGHNALTIVREISNANIYTALIGRGKGEESESGDGYGRKLTFENVVWSKSNGDPVDKPLGQKYVEIPEATEVYGIQTMNGKKPRIGIIEFADEEVAANLIHSTYQALLDTSRPLVQFQSTVAAMGNLKIGDTVTVHRYDLGIHYETRIFKVIRNRKNNKATELSLGDKVSLSSTERQRKLNSTVSELNKAQNDIKTEVSYVITNAVGNRITYGNTEPDRKRVGDMWYRDHPSLAGEKQMLIWNGEGWDITLDTSIENSVAEEVEAVRQEMDANKTATEQAINQAIIDANAYAEQQTSVLKTEVEANNEILDAAIATAQNRADAAFAEADAAFADAEVAKNNAFAATQTAQTAINDSITAINNAQTALDSLAAISGDLSDLDQSVQTKFTSIDGQISNMVTQTTFNALDQKVTSQGTLISQTQSTLLSKADKTVVDTINQTVGQHTTKIEQNAQAITARLTETQINNLLGTKNYVNQTTLTATASGLNASITQVSNDLSNLEVGGRNLLLGSKKIEITPNTRYVTKRLSKPILPNQKYTISIGYREWVTQVVSHESVLVSPRDDRGGTSTSIGVGVSPTFTVPIGGSATSIFTNTDYVIDTILFYSADENLVAGNEEFYFDVKVVEGEKDTGWTPAPEDMATLEQFTTIDATVKGLQTTVGNKAEQSQVTQLAGQISSKVESSTYNSKMTQLDSAISQRVTSSTYTSKMTQLDSAISQRVTSTTFESRITQLDNSIDLKVSSGIDGLEIGGRNLILNSDFSAGTFKWQGIDGGVKKDGNINYVTIVGTFDVSQNVETVKGQKYTISFLVRKATATNSKVSVKFNTDNADTNHAEVTSTAWTRVTLTRVATTSGSQTMYFHTRTDYPVDIAYIMFGEGNKVTNWSPAPEDVVTQINLSPEGVLIAGKRIRLDGDVTMEQAFINRLNTVTLNAVTANITTIRSQVLQANVVTSTHLQTSTATIDKLFATDAMVSRLTAKTAFINSVKAIDIEADRISGGTFNGNKMNVININASAISANDLSSITSNTGTLNVTGWINIVSENKGIKAEYDYGDPYGGAFNARWFTGDFRLGYRYISMDAEVFEVTPQNTKGAFRHKTVSYIGPDYFKFRQYNRAGTILYNRIDIAADYISMADKDFNNTNVMISSNGSSYFSSDMRVAGDLWVSGEKALKAYYVQAPETANNMYLNGGRNELGSMRLGLDGSTLNGGRLVSSDSVYKRTYSSAANVIVWDTGTIGRSVSARKYKLDIESQDLLSTALKTLAIKPSSWFDKGEVESIAKNLTENTIDSLDENFKLRRHYGFVADEFDEVGATEVVVYDSKGDVEGLAYDRISMYHHVMISDLYKRIEEQDKKIKELEGRIK